jgi:hypothetical protein
VLAGGVETEALVQPDGGRVVAEHVQGEPGDVPPDQLLLGGQHDGPAVAVAALLRIDLDLVYPGAVRSRRRRGKGEPDPADRDAVGLGREHEHAVGGHAVG